MSQSSNRSVNDKSSATYGRGLRRTYHAPGYAPGHAGDPQFEEPIAYTLEFPKNFYGLTLKERGQLIDDSLPQIKNPDGYFKFTNEDGVDRSESAKLLSQFEFPRLTRGELLRRATVNEGGPKTVLVLSDEPGEDIAELTLSDTKTDAEVDAWLKQSVKKHFDAYLENEKKWKMWEPDVEPPDDYSAEASAAIPRLEVLMQRLEKAGMQKYASRIREVAAQLHMEPFKLKERKRLSKGTPSGPGYTFDPSQRMLQEGEKYTEIDPTTGKEMQKRYQMQKPLPMQQLQTYFDRGMFDVDFFEDQARKETDPEKKRIIGQLLDKAKAQEEALRPKRAYVEGQRHWLSKPVELHVPPRKDPTEKFLMESLNTSPENQKSVIMELLDKYHEKTRPGATAIRKCAGMLRQKGYEALAERLEVKVAAGIYGPHVGVRIRSMKEYVAESKGKAGSDESMFDEMLDKYTRVLEGAAAIVKKAKVKMHDPRGLKDAMKTLLAADHLMMQKLLEIGEPIKETWS